MPYLLLVTAPLLSMVLGVTLGAPPFAPPTADPPLPLVAARVGVCVAAARAIAPAPFAAAAAAADVVAPPGAVVLFAAVGCVGTSCVLATPAAAWGCGCLLSAFEQPCAAS